MKKKQDSDKMIETNTSSVADSIRGIYPNRKRLPYICPKIEVSYLKQEFNILASSANLRPLADPQVYEWEEETTPGQGDIYL